MKCNFCVAVALTGSQMPCLRRTLQDMSFLEVWEDVKCSFCVAGMALGENQSSVEHEV